MSYKIEQLSIFIENRVGELGAITSLLEEKNISITSIMVSDSSEFGLLRVLTNELENAKIALVENGFMAKSSTVFGVRMQNHIGSFNTVVKLLTTANINIKYTYTINEKNIGIFIFKVDELDKAIEILLQNNIELITNKTIFEG